MKYRDLKIQTQRESPKNARTQGFSLLVRAGYLTRENHLTPLGEYTIAHLHSFANNPAFFENLSLPILGNDVESFFPIASGDIELVHCSNCKYTERLELALFRKVPLAQEQELPLQKILTPDCSTIEALANFLGIPKENTAKALMYTRVADSQLVFIVVRGDMQLSEAKLRMYVGEVRLATAVEIERAGAAAGYASPLGLTDSLIVVDDLIPASRNLVSGANEAGYHFKNTNYGRDYSAEIVADLVQAKEGDTCTKCAHPLSMLSVIHLATRKEYNYENILLALAETHHDNRGLTLPHPAAPFDVYLMHVPGKEIDTQEAAKKAYNSLQRNGVSVLFDDRDERAGVKFNDADLIGCPLRMTAGEKALKEGMIELKPRREKENELLPVDMFVKKTKSLL